MNTGPFSLSISAIQHFSYSALQLSRTQALADLLKAACKAAR